MRPFKVLIVEDRMMIAQKVARVVEKAGYEVAALARTEEEAVTEFQKKKPDLAIMDIKLDENEYGGIRAAERITDIRSIPIIYRTGYPDMIDRALQTFPVTFLTKNASDLDLANNIKVAINNFYRGMDITSPLPGVFFIKPLREESYKKFHIDDFYYLAANESITEIVTGDANKKLLIGHKLKYVINRINNDNILRVHKSHAVNADKVMEINKYRCSVILDINGETKELPIGRSYKERTYEVFNFL